MPGETLVLKELIPHIDQKFRTLTNTAGRSLHGYSMGGFGAFKLAFKFPDVFGSVVGFGATLGDAAEFKKHLGKVYSQCSVTIRNALRKRSVRARRTQRGENSRARGREFSCWNQRRLLERNRALHGKLQTLKILHDYEEVRGAGHKKDDLYEPAAMRAFEFSAQHFGHAKKSASLDK